MHLPLPWLIWAQVQLPGIPPRLVPTLIWFYILGHPGLTVNDYGPVVGGLITWLKVLGIFALLAWAVSWVAAALRTRTKARADVLDIAALAALGGCFLALVLNVLQTSGRVKPLIVAGFAIPPTLALACAAILLVWTERAIWSSIRRLGKASDLLVLVGIHLALGLGYAVAYAFLGGETSTDGKTLGRVRVDDLSKLGGLLGASYMGFVVLAKALWLLIPELVALRPRRLYAIARLAVLEATRKMWAPWVVIVLFGVILAFTHWFLPAPQQRPAELGRIFVGTLTLLCMLLLTVMVTVLAPLSLPQDIQAQTIYTVVSKPVRRLELIWGRIFGYMAIVTVLVLIFGGVSLVYLYRNIGGTIRDLEMKAVEAQETDPDRARFLVDQADQLRTRMSARQPVKGSLTFIDSLGKAQIKGIDVGQELEFRSHIEGGTPSAAIWQYGAQVVDPFDRRLRLNRRLPGRRPAPARDDRSDRE